MVLASKVFKIDSKTIISLLLSKSVKLAIVMKTSFCLTKTENVIIDFRQKNLHIQLLDNVNTNYSSIAESIFDSENPGYLVNLFIFSRKELSNNFN